jgi:hypothetical protein
MSTNSNDNIKDIKDVKDVKDIKDIVFRNRFLCRNCKKLLISKEALDTHIIICYESKIEKMKEDHKQEIEKIKEEYEKEIEQIIRYSDSIEQKHISLNNYLISQINKLASL